MIKLLGFIVIICAANESSGWLFILGFVMIIWG